MNDPHSVLGVARDADAATIKSAYRKLAKKCHPDLHPGDDKAEARFKEITAAYDACMKPQGQSGQQGQREWANYDNMSGFNRASFEEMFRRAGFNVEPTLDVNAVCAISLENAFSGCEIDVQMQSTGQVRRVTIPMGVQDGHRLKVSGGGRQGPSGVGDLILTVRVQQHPVWGREGDVLIRTFELDALTAVVGGKVMVETMEGEIVEVEIPGGMQHGAYVMVPGRGMPHGTMNARGDMAIIAQIVVPQKIGPEHAKTIKRLKDLLAASKKSA